MTWPTRRIPLRPHRRIEDTLSIMAKMIRANRDHPSIREMGARIAGACGPLDDVCRMQAVKRWVGSAMRYEKDPRGGDLLHDPVYLLAKIRSDGTVAGDCDDATILTSSLLETVGIPTRLTAISTRPDRQLHHVAAEGKDSRGTWYWLDAFSSRTDLPPTTRTLSVNV
jgi:transglutaminase-like putative cysteine protease